MHLEACLPCRIPAFLKKRRRKRKASSDDDPVLSTPPESEEEEESFVEKRRSTRHAKRKRYKDDVDLGISEKSDSSDDDDRSEPALKRPDIDAVVYAVRALQSAVLSRTFRHVANSQFRHVAEVAIELAIDNHALGFSIHDCIMCVYFRIIHRRKRRRL